MQPKEPTLYDQPVFWARFGGASLIDPLLPFVDGSDYVWRGHRVPDANREQFSARQQSEDQISVVPGSFLTMISAQSSAFPNDFYAEIIDKGSGQSLTSDKFRYMAATGGPNGIKFPNRPLPLILSEPWVITDPGLLTVRITNLATAANNICLFLVIAEKKK